MPALRSIVRRNKLAVAILLLIVASMLLRLGWAWHARRQVERAEAGLRERGEPMALSAYRLVEPPDDENAATVQLRAANLIAYMDSPHNSSIDYPDYPPYDAQWMALAKASEEKNASAILMARTARPLTRAFVGQPAMFNPNSYVPLNQMKLLVNTISDGALYRHLHGDDHEAIERVRDVVHVASSLRQDPTVISQIVANGIDAMACDSLLSIAPALNSRATTRPATREQVRALIDHLLDERPLQVGIVEGLRVDRLIMAEYTRAAGERTWFLRPLTDVGVARLHGNYDAMIAAAAEPNWPAARRAQSAGFHTIPARRQGRGRFYFDDFAGDYLAVMERVWRVRAERRLTAVALAMHLYSADHDGRLPATLDELVPQYLKTLPADPFQADGRPIGYVTLSNAVAPGTQRPMLYYDPGPTNTPPMPVPTYSWFNLGGATPTPRQYRDLTRWTPPPAPAPTTIPSQDSDAE